MSLRWAQSVPPYDNAMWESLFATLEGEFLDRRRTARFFRVARYHLRRWRGRDESISDTVNPPNSRPWKRGTTKQSQRYVIDCVGRQIHGTYIAQVHVVSVVDQHTANASGADGPIAVKVPKPLRASRLWDQPVR